MPGCGCAGGTCGCSVVEGAGIDVTGIGTAANPFVVSRNTSTDTIDPQIDVDDSTSIEFSKTGAGTIADPVVITGSVVLVSPNGTRFGLAVSNAGVLSTVAL